MPATQKNAIKSVSRVLSLPAGHTSPETQVKLPWKVEQEWECCVQDVSDDRLVFSSLLIDITDNQVQPTEESDFKMESINEADRHLVIPGAIFKWTIGYEQPFIDGKDLLSRIDFLPMPVFTSDMFDRATEKARQFVNGISWE